MTIGVRVGVGALLRNHGRYLLLKRRMDGRWSLPGGAVVPGEEPEATVCREMKEELGITIQSCGPVDACTFRAEGTPWVSILYEIRVYAGSPLVCEPETHSRLDWFADPAELRLTRVTRLVFGHWYRRR
jgi:8-oxo-dGTP pyrophosphatase MutT (NUDIX family)